MSDDSYVFEGPAEVPAPRDNNPPLSISELSFALKRTLEDRFGHVRLRGEVSKVNRHASGHVYLTLKDDKSAIDGVVWKGSVRGLGVQPEAGLEVIVTGSLAALALGGKSIDSPPATRLARFSSMLRSRPITRSRTCGKPTLDNSNTIAAMICACSISVCDWKNSRAWL